MKGVLAMDGICPTVAKAAVDGFDLDAMRAHMLTCEQCRPVLDAMTAVLQGTFDDDLLELEDDLFPDVPSMETLADWDNDGGDS